LIKNMVKMLLDIAKNAMDEDVQPELINMITALLEHDPKKPLINRFGEVFDNLKLIADKKPVLKMIIDKEIMDFVVGNREIIKPIIGKILDKSAKSLSLKLFKSGVDLDRVFDVAKANFSVDNIQDILSKLRVKGVANYGALGTKLFSSGVVGLVVGGAISYARNWWSTNSSKVAGELTEKISTMPVVGDVVGEVNLSDPYFRFPEIVAGKLNNNSKEGNKRLEISYLGELTLGSKRSPLTLNLKRLKDVGFDESTIEINSLNSEYIGCSFEGAKLSGRIENGIIKDCNFSKINLEEVEFKGVLIDGVDFKDFKKMERVKFENCTFRNCSFSQECLSKMAAVKNCHFDNNKFKGSLTEFEAFVLEHTSSLRLLAAVEHVDKAGVTAVATPAAPARGAVAADGVSAGAILTPRR
jgi:hypothetical protein